MRLCRLGITAPMVLSLTVGAPALVRAQSGLPTFDDILSMKAAQSPAISPDGRAVVYQVREANWDKNAWETELWIVDVASGAPRHLTNAEGSSNSAAWAPDGSRIAFLSDRGGTRQIYAIRPDGGEARQVTSVDGGVSRFAWAHDGARLAFVATDPVSDARKARDERAGEFEIVDEGLRMAHLYVVDADEGDEGEPRRLTEGPFVVGSIAWSPDDASVAFDHRTDSDPSSSESADISVARVSDGAVRALVEQAGPDSRPVWSPDGLRIAFTTSMGSEWFYYTNREIATVPAEGGSLDVLTGAFDEHASPIAWGPHGIYFSASDRTWSHLYRLDPISHSVIRLSRAPESTSAGFTFTRTFDAVAFAGADATTGQELFVADLPGQPTEGADGEHLQATRLTRMWDQARDWTLATREVISWASRDGTSIEGVLHKPADFERGRRYPLLVVIHGGPTGISRPQPLAYRTYPLDHFVAKGALVLEPNYRGSAGYGAAFRALNVRNLGVGDAWDVVSGVDHLIAEGLVDGNRVGAMGWSQGGYISAFLTTHDSDRFRAVSVGAGISDWMTYYVNTDIHPFTRQYLQATPWDDPEIYATTSPITYITQANTPTLIQHGELDRRVPLPNAYELYQGLRDQNVPVRLVVFKGFGHGLNKPKATRAAMEQNLEWFGRYIWGETETTQP